MPGPGPLAMIGQKLGSYTIEKTLGSGAMGVVYLARHEPTGKPAAIKVLTAEAAKSSSASKRFRREADILQQFRHPNIVRFLAVGRSQGTSYFAMEYVPGRTLDALLEERGALPWREVVDLGIQICEALDYTHERGVFHRDLKPSNLMLTAQDRVKLTDFGIAKDEDATALTATGRTLGTAAYMAPEQIRGTPEISHKTDLYALGVLLYQMIVGECPFQGKSHVVLMHAHLTQDPPRPSDKVAEIPKELDDLIHQLLAKDPTERPWDAAAVGLSLSKLKERAENSEPIPMAWPDQDVAPTRAGSVVRPRKRKGTAGRNGGRSLPAWSGTAALASALVALVGVVAYLLWPPGPDYLFRQAGSLMASDDPADWRRAQAEYLDDLDRRFPDHQHRAEVDAWRDKAALQRATDRAASMTKALGQIRPGAETRFQETYLDAEDARKAGKPSVSARLWRDLSVTLEGSREDRGWLLLARARAEEMGRIAARRRKEAEDLLARAAVAEQARLPEAAAKLRAEVVRNFSADPDLDDLVTRAREGPATGPVEAAPGVKGEGP